MDLIVDFPQASPRTRHTKSASSVSFLDESAVYFVEDLSCRYRDVLWYSHEDVEYIKRRTARMLLALRTHGMTMAQYAMLNIEDTSAFMGLETYLTDAGTREIRRRRIAARAAVLNEQHRQDKLGIQDVDAMASVSGAASATCRERAQVIALLHISKVEEQDKLLASLE